MLSTFSWVELQILLRCYLIHVTIVILRHILYLVYLCLWLHNFLLPPWDRGEWLLFHQPGRGATVKLQEPGWGHIQGGDYFKQSSRGGLLYHEELLVFPQNASPWILQISLAALSSIFKLFHKRTLLGVIALKSLTWLLCTIYNKLDWKSCITLKAFSCWYLFDYT